MPTKNLTPRQGLPTEITIRDRDADREGLINTQAYVKAKTRDLQKFGYSDLTEDTVRDQVIAILNGEKLTVIGMFMEGDIVVTS